MGRNKRQCQIQNGDGSSRGVLHAVEKLLPLGPTRTRFFRRQTNNSRKLNLSRLEYRRQNFVRSVKIKKKKPLTPTSLVLACGSSALGRGYLSTRTTDGRLQSSKHRN